MKRFLQAAFKITWFQVLIILVFTSLKYILVTYHLDDRIRNSFIWICLGAALFFLVAVSIMGIIENRGESYESYQERMQAGSRGKYLLTFVTWGFAIPAALAYATFLYLIAPASWYLFAALYVGIVIRNIIQFVSQKQGKSTQELN